MLLRRVSLVKTRLLNPKHLLHRSVSNNSYYNIPEEYESRYEPNIALNRISWEPDREVFDQFGADKHLTEFTMTTLIRRNLPAARKLFSEVLAKRYSREPGMYTKWAVMEWKAGHPAIARRIFTAGSKIEYNPQLWQSWATMESRERNFSQASKLYKVILSLQPDRFAAAAAELGLVQIQIENKKIEEAREAYERLIKEYDNDINILQAYAVFEGRQENLMRAREIFEQCVRHPDCTSLVWQAWAHHEMESGSLSFALDLIREGLERHPVNYQLLQVQANLEIKRENFDEARSILERIVNNTNATPEVFNTLGKMEESQRDFVAARAVYKQGLEIYPTHVPMITSFALLHERQGKKDLVRKVFQLGLENTNNDPQLLMRWAQTEEKTGHFKEARELYKRTSEERPSWLNPLLAWALVESRVGNLKSARHLMKDASERFKSNPDVFLAWGKLERKNKNQTHAAKYFEKAISLNKKYAPSWNYRATMEIYRNPERAKNLIESAFKVLYRTYYNPPVGLTMLHAARAAS